MILLLYYYYINATTLLQSVVCLSSCMIGLSSLSQWFSASFPRPCVPRYSMPLTLQYYLLLELGASVRVVAVQPVWIFLFYECNLVPGTFYVTFPRGDLIDILQTTVTELYKQSHETCIPREEIISTEFDCTAWLSEQKGRFYVRTHTQSTPASELQSVKSDEHVINE